MEWTRELNGGWGKAEERESHTMRRCGFDVADAARGQHVEYEGTNSVEKIKRIEILRLFVKKRKNQRKGNAQNGNKIKSKLK